MKNSNKKEIKAVEKITTAFCVVLKSEGNPDFNQYAPISPLQILPAQTLEEASIMCKKYIEDWDLGSGNWAGGDIYHPTKGLIAYVSYNGKVWKNLNNRERYTEEDLLKTYKDF